MNNLAIKEVNFNGDTLIAAQDQTSEKVYVGINHICEVLGLNSRKQRDKIKNHATLTKGCTTLVIPSNGGNQEMYVIELDFLPIWLATINPSLVKDEVVDKLIKYQLKAKDVLANAFIHNVKQIVPQTYKEALLALVESIEEKERLEAEKQILLTKAESYDTFIDGKNVQKMNDVAKSLGVGRNKLYEFLRTVGVLMKDNLPYQRYINGGYFKVKETPINKGFYITNKSQTYVTAKGVDFINGLLNEHGIERNL